MDAGSGLMVTVALPVIVAVQPDVFVAITVYVPAVVCRPKSSAPPVPGIVVPV